MSVVSVNEIRAGDVAEKSENTRSLVRTFRVVNSDPSDGANVARLASGIPGVGDAHPDESTAKCRSVRAAPAHDDDEGLVFLVVCAYRSSISNRQPGQTAEAPTSRDPITKLSFQSRTVTKLVNQAGAALATSGGEQLPVEINKPFLVLDVELNLASYAVSTAAAAVGTVNSGAITVAGYSIAARAGLLEDAGAEKLTEGDTTYYRVRYRILIKTDTWDFKLRNAGIWGKDGSGNRVRVQIGGQDVDQPWPLNSDGTWSENPTLSDAQYTLTERVYPENSWAGLSLPETW